MTKQLHPLTWQDLRKLGACTTAVGRFRRSFPHGALPTLENFRKAILNDLNPRWLARQALSYQQFDSIWSVCRDYWDW